MRKIDVLFYLKALQHYSPSIETDRALEIAISTVEETNVAECYICHELTAKPKEDDYGTEYCEKCFKQEGLE